MLMSKLFGKTTKTVPQDITAISSKLLFQGGFIRESTAGRYYFLPLGQRVQQKIMKVIKEEMDRAGGQEMIAPVLHPLSLWQETNRDTKTGFELMVIKDRRNGEFALGGTAEEMFVDIVRKFQLSYKDLPFNIYQLSTKFRDELRARGGLLRVREFIMKDAYSFHADATDFQKEYQNMWHTYRTIFNRLGLHVQVVESDNGYIGGDYCHEFILESPVGESTYLVNADESYAAHEDVAKFHKEEMNVTEKELPATEVTAHRGPTMEDGVKLHQKPLWQQIKDVLFVDEKKRFILAVIRGDYDVNEVKLKNAVHAIQLRHANAEEIRTSLHSEPGFISPVGLKERLEKGVELTLVVDDSLRTIKNAYGGANKINTDMLNINYMRDFTADIETDIALAKAGYTAPDKKQRLAQKKGIEVGNIFQLGYHYSKLMKDATFVDAEGKPQPYYMGCYGIGIGRTMAAVVEKYHDERGIMWPDTIAPYPVHWSGLDMTSDEIKKTATLVYEKLESHNIDVLFDDRYHVSAGEKFADADLIGIPIRLVVSKRTGDKIEFKRRCEKTTEQLPLEDIIKKISAI